jgi:NAD(P)-dependent dehydrogenase (short-subunit alcohol dehydrogenase family)
MRELMTNNYATYPSLRGRVVLITGGAAGIGAAMVEAFHAQDAKVAFLDIDEKTAVILNERLSKSKSPKPYFLKCDVRDIKMLQKSISTISKDFGKIHTLINNAGGTERLSANEITLEKWENFQSLNLRHVLFASQAVFPDMCEMGGGSIINFTSPTFRRRTEGWAGYAAAKSGIEGLSRILAREYGEARIRVNSIMPGWTATEHHKKNFLTPEVEADLMSVQCLKQLVLPEDIARIALFLSSDDSDFMTAQVYKGDAGLV